MYGAWQVGVIDLGTGVGLTELKSSGLQYGAQIEVSTDIVRVGKLAAKSYLGRA
jgi:hypothetical protein